MQLAVCSKNEEENVIILSNISCMHLCLKISGINADRFLRNNILKGLSRLSRFGLTMYL